MGCLAFILILAIFYAISWAFTVGLIHLICLCFGIAFSLKVATGIWIILCFLRTSIKIKLG